MPIEDNNYSCLIDRGHSEYNDRIIDYLKPHIVPPYLDVGANGGFLLSEVPVGVGIDLSLKMVKICKERGLDVQHADARELPFPDQSFETVVISTVLHQMEDWEKAMDECVRVARIKVIGIENYPLASPWGMVGETEWVLSHVNPFHLNAKYGASITRVDDIHYFFEIKSGR